MRRSARAKINREASAKIKRERQTHHKLSFRVGYESRPRKISVFLNRFSASIRVRIGSIGVSNGKFLFHQSLPDPLVGQRVEKRIERARSGAGAFVVRQARESYENPVFCATKRNIVRSTQLRRQATRRCPLWGHFFLRSSVPLSILLTDGHSLIVPRNSAIFNN
jgi:hypothetical protein